MANTDQAAIEAIIETAQSTGLVAYAGELMLLDWAKSSCKDGPKIKLLAQDDDDIEPFARATTRKGKVAGQRYRVLFFEVGDDETIVPEKPKGGALAKLAGMLCDDPEFRRFLYVRSANDSPKILSSADARDVILRICDINSRAELDHNPDAARKFHERIRLPFLNWKQSDSRGAKT